MTHKFAKASDIAKQSDPPHVSLGLEAGPAQPRPDLNGFRLLDPASGKVYLMLDGLRCWVPNPPTYNNLFRNWEHIITDIHLDEVAAGPDITNGAVLAVGTGGGAVYLVTNGQKRHVSSPATMDKYNFAWNRVVGVPPVLLDFISTGVPIS